MSLTDSSCSIDPAATIDVALPAHPLFSDAAMPCDAFRGELRVTLQLKHAGTRHVRIAYECVGKAHAPAIVLAGGISAHRHAIASRTFAQDGWWQSQAASFDGEQHRYLSIDWLGADGELDVPIDAADQADAIAAVLQHLRIEILDAFIGCSYGAMVGLQFAARYPQALRRLIAISGAHRPHPYASAWRALQRRIVALGALQCDAVSGLALARELAMLSYRTPEEFAERFDAAPLIVGDRAQCSADAYLQHCGVQYAARVKPEAFLRLSESIDLHQVEPSHIRVPVTVVAVAEDRLVPLTDCCVLARALPQGRLRILHSRYGHDAFLKEPAAIADVLANACNIAEITA